MTFLKDYGTTEGPLGFPMTDKQARALDALLRALPKGDEYAYRKAVAHKGPTEVSPGERSDVSWISTEDPDRAGDVVLARGMNDSQFKHNPIVTLNHAYWAPPVGRSLWRKVTRDGELKGVKAKTVYPGRPGDWPEAKDWPPDIAFTLVGAGLLCGKSIGFLPTRVHLPDSKEREQHGWKDVGLVVDEWLLLEYACTFLPVQQNATITEVGGKALPDYVVKALGLPETAKGAVPYQETPKADEQREWDAAAARQRLRDWAGGDLKKYRQGFAYVKGDGSKLDDYLLPHHDIVGGELKVVWNGVKAAMAALHGARADMGLPDEDARAVHHHLARHYEQFDRKPPEVRALDDPVIAFTPVEEIEKSIARRIEAVDFAALARQAVADAFDRARGRV